MAASHYRLDKLTLVVDRNGCSRAIAPSETMSLEPLADRWRAFGWSVVEVDGHESRAGSSIRAGPRAPGQPTCVIAHTHKGRGVSFIEDRAEWHHRVPTDAELARRWRNWGPTA